MDRTLEIYTQEHIVFATNPGHHVLSDGNHRSKKALMNGRLGELPREVIGHLPKDVSQDPNYRHIRELEILSGTYGKIS